MPNIRALFVVPEFPARTYPGKTMGPDYMAAQLVRRGFSSPEQIDIVDLDVLERGAFSSALKSTPDFVGISALSFQLPQALEIAMQVHEYLSSVGMRDEKNAAKYVPIVIGNHGASEVGEIAADYPFVDAWAQSHAFETIIDIAKAIGASKNGGEHFLEARRNISGIVYYNAVAGVAATNANKPFSEDFDSYFPPYRQHHYPQYNFRDIFGDKKTAQVITQLGCPATCVFCFEGMFDGAVYRRSKESVRAELESLIAQGYRAFYLGLTAK